MFISAFSKNWWRLISYTAYSCNEVRRKRRRRRRRRRRVFGQRKEPAVNGRKGLCIGTNMQDLMAAATLGKLPTPNTVTHRNNTAGCCTMTKPLPERLNTARYTLPPRREGAGEETGCSSCSLCVCVCAYICHISLSEKIPLTPFLSHCDSRAPPWEEHEYSSQQSETQIT